jgi:hypothetical protein
MHHESGKPAAPLAPLQLRGDEVAPRPEVAIAAHLETVEIVASFTAFVDAKDQTHRDLGSRQLVQIARDLADGLLFGPDYQPEPYIVEEYKRARNHKWYMTSRLITVNDIYSFDPSAKVNLDDFVDIIGRNFKQPKEGLGLDNSPSAHMWRTMMWPTRFL